MKKLLIISILLLAILSGCTEPIEPTNDPVENDTPAVEKGLSIEDAIVIQEDYEEPGVKAEYDYLTDNACPNNGGPKEVLEQTIDYDDKESIYDVLTVECQDGEIILYYFNIDRFFGKWE